MIRRWFNRGQVIQKLDRDIAQAEAFIKTLQEKNGILSLENSVLRAQLAEQTKLLEETAVRLRNIMRLEEKREALK